MIIYVNTIEIKEKKARKENGSYGYMHGSYYNYTIHMYTYIAMPMLTQTPTVDEDASLCLYIYQTKDWLININIVKIN